MSLATPVVHAWPAGGATRVLVTGADGLLGSWLVKVLLGAGAGVTVLRRAAPPASPLELEGTIAEVEVVHGDVRDGPAMARALGGRSVDTVFHLAGQAISGTADRAPVETFETNVAGTWNVLEACRKAGVERVVLASSHTVYGAQAAPTESRPLPASPPYDASKVAAEAIARSYSVAYGMAVGVARLANVYGGGDLHASRLVPGSVWAALGGRRPVIRSDGTPRRDFVYVEDAVAAYLAIAGALGAGAGGETFNAGGGRARPVIDIVRAVLTAAGAAFAPDVRGAGVAVPPAADQAVDHGKLTRLTGWAPGVELADGMARTVDWYRRYAPVDPGRRRRTH